MQRVRSEEEQGLIEVPGGRLWFRRLGGEGVPLVCLHGGPGSSHFQLEPLARLAQERPVIFYDQLGCGNSERPTDTGLWRLERFVEELDVVLSRLGVSSFDFFGHSWGSMLAVQYVLDRRPRGLRSLILSGPYLSVSRWIEDQRRLTKRLPQAMQDAIQRAEAESRFDDPAFRAAVDAFYAWHRCRLDPPPVEFARTRAVFNQQIYETMWGPCEFVVTGSLRDFEVADRLGEIDVPTLITSGRHDMATPATTEAYRKRIPGAKRVVFERSAHVPILEETERYVAAVGGYLREIES